MTLRFGRRALSKTSIEFIHQDVKKCFQFFNNLKYSWNISYIKYRMTTLTYC